MHRAARVLTILLSLCLPLAVAAQSPNAQLVSAARGDVGLVVATQCPHGKDRSGTAFVWPAADQVVTARHVVAGCGQINVQFRNHGSFIAVPLREIRAQDLIALRLDAEVDAMVQTVTTDSPPVHSRVAAVGFALGAPTADDKLLTVTTANDPPPARLRQMLPDAERQQIERNGPWDLETAIIRLDGNLTHGHSGAPLLDHAGRVVAIGAGGLQSGASGIVWAVSASYLLDSGSWTDIRPGQRVDPENTLTFSVQPPQSRLDQVGCGDFALSRSRTSSFDEIAASVDDPNGLYQVQAAVGFGYPIDFSSMQFDIWEDLQSGAVVPLPEGTRPQPGPGGCTADAGNGVTIWIRSFDGSDQPYDFFQINAFSAQLENDVSFSLGQLFPDPNFTYSHPITRPDGFIANRKGAMGLQVPLDMTRGYQNYGFITHVARSGYYLGVAALRRESVIDLGQVNQCLAGNISVCDQALAPLHAWASAALSVHMSTMPPI
ncbi:S1 family peptidase [Bauldia sp.]|uniref:S1 family peptidase n=1 Tax=Bauldia sp. TaxID=2575872 RepID=UPI003BACD868